MFCETSPLVRLMIGCCESKPENELSAVLPIVNPPLSLVVLGRLCYFCLIQSNFCYKGDIIINIENEVTNYTPYESNDDPVAHDFIVLYKFLYFLITHFAMYKKGRRAGNWVAKFLDDEDDRF